MQTNVLLTSGTARSIDAHIDRLLKDLETAEPPVRLEDVRELLRLDLRHYTSTDESWLRDKVHKLRVAGKQVLARPGLMLDVVRTLGLKGLLLPDRRRILIDGDLPTPKQRWSEAHEILHDLLPWHDELAHGDPLHTLDPACHEQIEAEANYGAGRLLFLGNRFVDHLRDSELTLVHVRDLAKLFGNSITSTLWRCVEHSDGLCFALVSEHPGEPPHSLQPVRYFVRSSAFAVEFAGTPAEHLFRCACRYCRRGRGPLGAREIPLADANGAQREFRVETFFNGHEALTLGVLR